MTNIRNLKKSHLPVTRCQGRGTPAHSLVSKPLLRVPSHPRRQPVLTAAAEAFMGRNKLVVRVGPTGVCLPECHHLSPGPISPLLPGLSTSSLNCPSPSRPTLQTQTCPCICQHRSLSWEVTRTRLHVWLMPEAVA